MHELPSATVLTRARLAHLEGDPEPPCGAQYGHEGAAVAKDGITCQHVGARFQPRDASTRPGTGSRFLQLGRPGC
jgi:hypothetical protein